MYIAFRWTYFPNYLATKQTRCYIYIYTPLWVFYLTSNNTIYFFVIEILEDGKIPHAFNY